MGGSERKDALGVGRDGTGNSREVVASPNAATNSSKLPGPTMMSERPGPSSGRMTSSPGVPVHVSSPHCLVHWTSMT